MFGLSELLALRRDPLAFFDRLHSEQGDVATLRFGWTRAHVLFHPDEIEDVLTHQADAFVRLERVMETLAQWNGRSLLILEGEPWRARRRRVLAALSRRRVERVAGLADRRAAALCGNWRTAADAKGGLEVDVDRAMARLALDIGLEALFGRTAADSDAMTAAMEDLSDVAYRETAGLWRAPMWAPFGDGARKRKARGLIDGFVEAAIRERAGDDDLLEAILAEADPAAARDDAVTLLIAGHETTGAALCWLMAALGGDHAALARVQQEIDALGIAERPLEPADLRRAPFLAACVQETLRLRPPAYALFPRRAVRAVEIGRTKLAVGDLALIAPHATQRDPRWFPEPQEFRPARFLGAASWPAYAYIPFGAGPRVCIGQHFGMLELSAASARLLAHISPRLPQGEVVPKGRFSLRPSGGLRMRLQLR